jgi:hypothetical protein
VKRFAQPVPFTTDYRLLAIALVLLWLPRQWLRLGRLGNRKRGRKAQEWSPQRERLPGDVAVRIGEEFSKPRNWLDFLRSFTGGAAVGGTLFVGTAIFTMTDPKPERDAVLLVFALKAFILLVGLLIQTLRLEERITLFAPLFYIQGLSFGLIGYKAALLALIATWALNAALPSAAVLLLVFGTICACLGMVLDANHADLGLAVALIFLPGLLSLLMKRRLAQFTKRTKIIASSSSSN